MWKPNLDQMSVFIVLKKSNWSLLGCSCKGPYQSWAAGKSPVPGHQDCDKRLWDLASSSAMSRSSSFEDSGLLPSSLGDLYTAE